MNTYIYAYKTSDGMRHEERMRAPSREEVFASLRKQGIKAIKVVAADGSKANGEIRGVRKRIVALAMLLVAAVVGVIAYVLSVRSVEEAKIVIGGFDARERRQVIGDVGIIEKGIATGWADVFELEGERFLASFAIPGVPAGQRSTTEEEIREALAHEQKPSEGCSLEDRQIISMVEGMKDELRRFIASGKHTISEYGKRLVLRQEQEIAYYQRFKNEIETAAKGNVSRQELLTLWENRNEKLRAMGIKLVPMPE